MMSKRILLGNKSVQKDKDNAERRISKKKQKKKKQEKTKEKVVYQIYLIS